MLHKDIFNIPQCRKYEWRSWRDRRTNLGQGRVLWIQAVTVTGQKVDFINVYQHTSSYPQKQQRLQAALAKALSMITSPCMLFGDISTVKWISPLHDHARVSFTVGDTVWGNIQPPEPVLTPPNTLASDKLKLEQMIPLLSIIDETCTPLALQLLDSQNPISSSDSVQQLLETRRSLFLKLTPKKQYIYTHTRTHTHTHTHKPLLSMSDSCLCPTLTSLCSSTHTCRVRVCVSLYPCRTLVYVRHSLFYVGRLERLPEKKWTN